MTYQQFTLANGVVVLARGTGAVTRGENGADHFDIWPYHFSNRTQAERKAAQLRSEGTDAHVYKSPSARPWYVALPQTGQPSVYVCWNCGEAAKRGESHACDKDSQ